MRILINGFGRIGRMLVRAICENNLPITSIHINSPGSIESALHLLKYDSVHGVFGVSLEGGRIVVNEKKNLNIHYTQHKSIQDINGECTFDYAFECSGKFNNTANQHLQHSKRVLISAPSDVGKTIIYGVNHKSISKDDNIISAGSCTTNCLGVNMAILHETFKIQKCHALTVHAYTNDQNILDATHKKDFYRARAAGLSIIPSSTGADKTIKKIYPEMEGVLSCSAVRVPVPNVSMLDINAIISSPTTAQTINNTILNYQENDMKNVISSSDEGIVSIDVNHTNTTCTFDLTQTKVIDGDMIRVVSWYDNEFGFANRMLDIMLAWERSQ